jgi:hypothetical protein
MVGQKFLKINHGGAPWNALPGSVDVKPFAKLLQKNTDQ